MSYFDKLTDEILEFFWKSYPIGATFMGIHKYDHDLNRMDRDSLIDINKKTKEYLTKLSRIAREELSDDEYIDWRFLQADLESDIKTFEEIRYWERNPTDYARICLNGIHILFLRDFAPIRERTEAILARMEKVPQFLKSIRSNLKNSPEIFTKLAIETVERGQLFFKKITTQLCEMVPELESRLESTATKANEAFEEYNKFLKTQHLPMSKGEFAIGKDLFNFKLNKDHMLPYDADEILEIGHEAKKSTENELEAIAKTIDRGKPWWEIADEIKDHHPQPAELLATYRKNVEVTKRFVQEKDIVTVPHEEELIVIPTPHFSRPTLPKAAYMPPAPFEEQQTGFFYVTPVDESLPKEKQKEMLRGHPICGIPIIALHEGYPGHHLQLVRANRVESRLRRLLRSTVFIEGWALYCEEMMYDEGFYSDPRTQLLKLKDQLMRACRVIIDVGLHTRNMDYTQAVDILINDAKVERINAEKEVTRYTFTPTQPLSYLIGKKQVLELRKDYQQKVGKNFVLKEFHDKLLSFGSIPIVLIREALGL